jgi:hypothetical protein
VSFSLVRFTSWVAIATDERRKTSVCDGHQCNHVFVICVNLSDAHLENQHTEFTFLSNCVVCVLNAHFSFHLSVQLSQHFMVVDRVSAKGLRSSFWLSKDVQSWFRKYIPGACFWHVPRGPFLGT